MGPFDKTIRIIKDQFKDAVSLLESGSKLVVCYLVQ